MSEDILINVTAHETRVAVIERGAAQEIHFERNAARGIVGNIYLGSVVRVLPGMQSAFISIGGERAAFLHVADIWRLAVEDQPPLAIEQQLSAGQTLLVQVIKDPIGSKGARLTTQLSIAGRLLVYLPQEQHIGISQRIVDEAERERLRQALAACLPQADSGGYILRTMAEGASAAELAADVDYLHKTWYGIQQQAATASAHQLLYCDFDLSLRVLRDFVHSQQQRIIVDELQTYTRLQQFAVQFMPQISAQLQLDEAAPPLFERYGIETEIERALARRVELACGGYIVIDQTEALVTIDVNTGGFVGDHSFDETIYQTNLEAATVIARQLRLRNLGGMIMIDFIDMTPEEHRTQVLEALHQATATDRTRLMIHGFTQLGLVELTRKRTRESLSHVLCEPCSRCAGRGEMKTAQTMCFEIIRELHKVAARSTAPALRVYAAPAVVAQLQDPQMQYWTHATASLSRVVTLHSETSFGQEQYDVVA
jgi:ribonuclease G